MTVGSNCTLRVTAWPGFNVAGNVPPESEKPVPVTVAELTVTAAVPVDCKVTDCIAGAFTTTLPNDTLVALMLSVDVNAAVVVVPVPLRVITEVGLDDELLVTAS